MLEFQFQPDQSVRINAGEIEEYIDRGVGRIVGLVPDSPYLSVDFQKPEPENLWLLPSEVIPVSPVVRNYPSIVECFGIGYEVPSNDPDPLSDPSIVWHEYAPATSEPIEWHEF